MPVASRNSVSEGFSAMPALSQNVICDATEKYHILCGDILFTNCDNRRMASDEKNGGPNHLRAWREKRGMTQEELADAVGTNQNMIAYLETGERGLSAKWLRRLAVPLNTTPGMILDHDPNDLPADILEIWGTADARQRRQLVDIAKTLVTSSATG